MIIGIDQPLGHRREDRLSLITKHSTVFVSRLYFASFRNSILLLNALTSLTWDYFAFLT